MSTNSERVANSRKRQKERMVYVMGGKCQICGYDKCIEALDFHHINPEEKDFQISSGNTKGWDKVCKELQKCAMLCANCHRELHANLLKDIELYSPYDEDKANEIKKKIEDLRTHKVCYCKSCGKEISSKTKTGYCADCLKKPKVKTILQSNVVRPNREELKSKIREQSFCSIGKEYNVTDNAVRKWCVKYNLPKTKKEINSYTDEEWKNI